MSDDAASRDARDLAALRGLLHDQREALRRARDAADTLRRIIDDAQRAYSAAMIVVRRLEGNDDGA